MGSWNKTCGLSNLHIYAGTEVYVFALVENRTENDRCYSTSFWWPIPLPFVAKYNDYGGGQDYDENSGSLKFLMSYLKDEMVEVEEGENQYHDIPVKRADFNTELFFEAVNEGRLKVMDHFKQQPRQVDFVMIRKDVADQILATRKFQKYISSGNYQYFSFTDLQAELEGILDAFSNEQPYFLDTVLSRGWDDGYAGRLLYGVVGHTHIGSRDILSKVKEYIDAGERDAARELLNGMLVAAALESFMEGIRKFWAPGGFEGSQADCRDLYRIWTDAINDALTKEQAEWDAEYGEFDVEDSNNQQNS